MKDNLFMVDTNVLIYLLSANDDSKRTIADSLMLQNPIVANQVVTEFINVSRRLLKISKTELMQRVNLLFANSVIIPTTHRVLFDAQTLITEYDFQIFDAIIVASALAANCTILYSEDMLHGLVVRNKLTILNPFL